MNHRGGALTAAGTPVAAQVAGDCLQQACDGAGGVGSIVDSGDIPADDGNLCTSEVCSGGVPAHPAKGDGVACDDGDACTRSESCQAGSCAGSSPVACALPDPCHVAGACDPATGVCSNPAGVDVSYICDQIYNFNPTSGALAWHYQGNCSGGGGRTSVLFGGELYVRDASATLQRKRRGGRRRECSCGIGLARPTSSSSHSRGARPGQAWLVGS